MKVDYLYEAGPFGSYKNAKSSNKDSLQKLAAEGIFEKCKEEIMKVYVKDIKDLMDTMDTKFGGRIEKYRVCNRYVMDESPYTYGVGARIYLRGKTVVIEQLLTPKMTSIYYYNCPEEFTFWENEEQKLQEMFPRYTFKIVFDWVYMSNGLLWATKVNSDVDNLEHYPFPYPLETSTSDCIALGSNVTLDMFIKYWNRFISTSDYVKKIVLDEPNMDSLNITIPTDFRVESVEIRGGENLTDISGISKCLIGKQEVTYNLYRFASDILMIHDGRRRLSIKGRYKQHPVFEQATNGVLSLDNLTYLFDNSVNGILLFPYFTYNISTGNGRLFNISNTKRDKYYYTNWFDKDGFKATVDAFLK